MFERSGHVFGRELLDGIFHVLIERSYFGDCPGGQGLDRQLAGAWGGGAKMYRSGPFHKGKPEHGYQLALTPREFFAAGVVATN